MTKNQYRWFIAAAAIMLALFAWGMCAFLKSSPNETMEQGATATDAATLPKPSEVPTHRTDDQHKEQQRLAFEAATIMTTWSPAGDLSKSDAILRAEQYFAEEFIADFQPAPRASGSEWARAAKLYATSIPEVTIVNTHQEPYVVEISVTWNWETPDETLHSGDPSTQPQLFTFVFNEENQIVAYR